MAHRAEAVSSVDVSGTTWRLLANLILLGSQWKFENCFLYSPIRIHDFLFFSSCWCMCARTCMSVCVCAYICRGVSMLMCRIAHGCGCAYVCVPVRGHPWEPAILLGPRAHQLERLGQGIPGILWFQPPQCWDYTAHHHARLRTEVLLPLCKHFINSSMASTPRSHSLLISQIY